MKQIVRGFLFKAVTVFAVWMILYYGYISPNGRLDRWLTVSVLESTVSVLSVLGYNAENSNRVVFIDGQSSVAVGNECNGLELIALFIGFFLCFPGPVKYKLLFIPVGAALIYCMNIIREVLLVLNYHYYEQSFEFNHKYTYVLLVYLGVFLIWRFWLNNYSSIGRKVVTN